MLSSHLSFGTRSSSAVAREEVQEKCPLGNVCKLKAFAYVLIACRGRERDRERIIETIFRAALPSDPRPTKFSFSIGLAVKNYNLLPLISSDTLIPFPPLPRHPPPPRPLSLSLALSLSLSLTHSSVLESG